MVFSQRSKEAPAESQEGLQQDFISLASFLGDVLIIWGPQTRGPSVPGTLGSIPWKHLSIAATSPLPSPPKGSSTRAEGICPKSMIPTPNFLECLHTPYFGTVDSLGSLGIEGHSYLRGLV